MVFEFFLNEFLFFFIKQPMRGRNRQQNKHGIYKRLTVIFLLLNSILFFSLTQQTPRNNKQTKLKRQSIIIKG